jgi:hypothetical protein
VTRIETMEGTSGEEEINQKSEKGGTRGGPRRPLRNTRNSGGRSPTSRRHRLVATADGVGCLHRGCMSLCGEGEHEPSRRKSKGMS